jgi:CheY-like chemotaxis protein
LTISRKQIVQSQPVNLSALVQESHDMLGRILGEDVQTVTDLDTESGLILADAAQLHQVLMNLAVNARDAMPEGGSLTLRTLRMDLDENSAAHYQASPGRYVVLEVCDTGVGMSEEVQKKIFEPFYTTKGEAGTGLGLPTVYGIVQQAGGWIAVESQLGAGTTFRIGLPFLSEAAPPSPGSGTLSTQFEGSETVLVVEDQEEVRNLAVMALKSFGYRTLQAASGDAALAIVADLPEPIHLVLTDVVMPGMNGRHLAERLRQLHPDIKVLYMSGYAAEVLARNGPFGPGTAYIAKPFTPEGLALQARKLLGERRTS